MEENTRASMNEKLKAIKPAKMKEQQIITKTL